MHTRLHGLNPVEEIPRLREVRIRNYRSVGDGEVRVSISTPQNGPTILIGENNAGKSNILRAIDLILGERWPGSWQPDDHDHYGRSRSTSEICIRAYVTGLKCYFHNRFTAFRWQSSSEDVFTFECECNESGSSHSRRPKGEWRDSIFALFLTSSFDIRHQLSYGSNWTLLSKLMRQFHTQLVSDPARTQRLKDVFEQTIDIFDEVEEFREFKDGLATASSEVAADLQYALDIDFSSYDPSNFFKSLRLNPSESGSARAFDELGSGQQQLLMLAFSQAYARAFKGKSSLILLCDEPETHLHPIAQRALARHLSDTSFHNNTQIVIATHSPEFIDLSSVENLVRVSRDPEDGATVVLQHSSSSFHHAAGQPNDHFEASATFDHKAAMFSRLCVIVEGPTEALAYPVLLRKLGPKFDPDRLGISFVSVSSVTSIPKWLSFYTAWDIPTYAIYDTDNWSADSKKSVRRRIWTVSGGPPDDEPVSSGHLSAMLHSTKWAALQHADFESMAGSVFGNVWLDLLDDAQAKIGHEGGLKPLRAKYAAESLDVRYLSADAIDSIAALGNALRTRLGLKPVDPLATVGDSGTLVETEDDAFWDELPF